MRSESEVDQFGGALLAQYGDEDPRVKYEIECFDACIPKSFWNVQADDVSHNKGAFAEVVDPYRRRWKKVLKHGYSLLFVGDNGAGKTMFCCYLLTQAIKRGQSAYYTTLAQLDIDIKSGFRDKASEDRLAAMLKSDFVVIDEVGKESFKADGYTTMRLELFLKQRYDDAEPVLLASNIDHQSLCRMYGSSVESMLDGRYRTVTLEPGDFRKVAKKSMKRDMGYS